MTLYKHNQDAYEKVIEAFNTTNKAAIVHATGTGKSYIIAAVAEHYNRVLVIAPNNFVLGETRKVCKDGVEFRTYASVMYDDTPQQYDLIVLDEFHRSGADKWGDGVKKLLDANKEAKILGTSATHIRYLDGQRNMADEIFDGNIVSYLPLKDALDQGILPTPTYVASLYSMKDVTKDYTQRINESKLSQETKDEYLRQLKGIAQSWEQSHGVPNIIRKYFDKEMQRIIVFCSNVSKAKRVREMLSQWFADAGYSRLRFYNIDYKEKRLAKEMEDFQEPVADGELKVAISVNMLNEGIHIPRVDGVIMLRSTISRIIIEQQIGRCLTADNKHRTPVVLDLVNNMDLIAYDSPTFTDGNKEKEHSGESGKESYAFPFNVIDECRDIRVFFEQMDSETELLHRWTYEELKEVALKYTKFKEFSDKEQNACSAARARGIISDICSHMEFLRTKWSEEKCAEIALKYKTKGEFVKYDNKAYCYAKRKKILDKICAHMTSPITRWTFELCKEHASQFQTASEFFRKDKRAYDAAVKYKWIDEFYVRERVRWTYDMCKEEALKYNYKNDFLKGNNKAYEAARRHGWLDDICAHMQPARTKTNENDNNNDNNKQ